MPSPLFTATYALGPERAKFERTTKNNQVTGECLSQPLHRSGCAEAVALGGIARFWLLGLAWSGWRDSHARKAHSYFSRAIWYMSNTQCTQPLAQQSSSCGSLGGCGRGSRVSFGEGSGADMGASIAPAPRGVELSAHARRHAAVAVAARDVPAGQAPQVPRAEAAVRAARAAQAAQAVRSWQAVPAARVERAVQVALAAWGRAARRPCNGTWCGLARTPRRPAMRKPPARRAAET